MGSAAAEWSRVFKAPIYLHADDREWVMRKDANIFFWEGEINSTNNEVTPILCGGHFPGGTVLQWASGAYGKGALLSGDIMTVVSYRRHVSFMYSYPNLVPLAARGVRHIIDAVKPYAFDRIYGTWWDRVVQLKCGTSLNENQ